MLMLRIPATAFLFVSLAYSESTSAAACQQQRIAAARPSFSQCPRDPEFVPRRPVPAAKPQKVCATLFMDPGFGGRSFTLYEKSKVADFSGQLYERRKWNGTLSGWSGSDRSFNDEFSSVQVTEACQLTVWDASEYIGETADIAGIDPYMPLQDSISSATCSCDPGPVPPPFMLVGPAQYYSDVPTN